MRRVLLTAWISLAMMGLARAADDGFVTIYGGPDDVGHWVRNNDGKPVPKACAEADGLNPHKAGSYITLYEKPMHDFIFDFDYKISKGCNSGIFIRVGKREDPVMTGLEIAIDDTYGKGMHDPGAFYDLVKVKSQKQKPAGEWNHMTVTCKGPIVTIVLNGEEVSKLNHDEFSEPSKRPDGSTHKFTGVAIKDLNQKGSFGFQDHGSDCWYKNVKVKCLD